MTADAVDVLLTWFGKNGWIHPDEAVDDRVNCHEGLLFTRGSPVLRCPRCQCADETLMGWAHCQVRVTMGIVALSGGSSSGVDTEWRLQLYWGRCSFVCRASSGVSETYVHVHQNEF